jgi:hypothetical protein
MDPEVIANWVQIAAGLGAIAIAGWALRVYWHYWRWKQFEDLVRKWARREEFDIDRLTVEDWKSLAAIRLSEAHFTAFEIVALLDVAIVVAKGRASIEFRGRI